MSTWTDPSYSGGWIVPGFTELRELGRGATGRVVEAVHDASGRRVAIKYLSPDLVGDQMFLGRFRAEARWLLESGAQRAAVRVYDYVEQPGRGAAIVLELADWAALHEMIEAELLPLLAGDDTAPASSASAAWSWEADASAGSPPSHRSRRPRLSSSGEWLRR